MIIDPHRRWDAEDFYLQTGACNVLKLFQEVFRKTGVDEFVPITDKHDKSDVLDELGLDESLQYKEKIGKYIRRSLQCVADPVFWFLMNAAHTVRGPWLHFYRFLCAKRNSANAYGRLHIVDLVSRRIFSINASFEQLVGSLPQWVKHACECSKQIRDSNIAFDEYLMTSVAASLLMQTSATFHRRVARPYSRLGFEWNRNTVQLYMLAKYWQTVIWVHNCHYRNCMSGLLWQHHTVTTM